MKRSPHDHWDPEVPSNWIVWQAPARDLQGRWFVGFTRWVSMAVRRVPRTQKTWTAESVVEFMRYENIDDDPAPEQIEISWSAWGDRALRVPHNDDPLLSVAQEPSIVRLPDQRLFCTMRTMTGYIWYSLSADDGETWCSPRPLLRQDCGLPILQPIFGCPIYQLADGRYLLIHHNNDGRLNGCEPEDSRVNRRPCFAALGEFRPGADQPIWFSDSKQLMDNDNVKLGPRQGIDIGGYTSFTTRGGNNVFWHPERKFFLLGKKITPEFLADLVVPEGTVAGRRPERGDQGTGVRGRQQVAAVRHSSSCRTGVIVMSTDPRNILNGLAIPSENYVDQPYIVITQDGNWLCVLTTGPGQESQEGQHVVATISADKGQTWSPLIDIESTHEPINSWVTAAVMPTGRAYAFYCYNADGISSMHGGWLAFRYSDDNGRTWSQRHRIEMRYTKKDRENFSGGKTQFWWCIDKPVMWQGSLYFGIPKIHNGFLLDDDEGWVIRGDGIATATDPAQIVWHTLPDGDEGVVNPALGPICEEQNIEVLSDGTLYMVNRTVSGYPSYAISRDQGHTWTVPQIMRYADGRPMKTPRACPRVWKASNGKFLFWFHNNSFPGWGNSGNRNPVWVSGGIEQDGDIAWSQPEILLYAPDPTMLGMSYPDFVEQDGRYWASETQKMVARVHEMDPALLEAVWTQHENKTVAQRGLIFESQGTLNSGNTFDLPRLAQPGRRRLHDRDVAGVEPGGRKPAGVQHVGPATPRGADHHRAQRHAQAGDHRRAGAALAGDGGWAGSLPRGAQRAHLELGHRPVDDHAGQAAPRGLHRGWRGQDRLDGGGWRAVRRRPASHPGLVAAPPVSGRGQRGQRARQDRGQPARPHPPAAHLRPLPADL